VELRIEALKLQTVQRVRTIGSVEVQLLL